MIDATKFIGRKSSPCRRCNSRLHYVNPMGGVSCVACYPPRKPEHAILRLIDDGGTWQTESESFTPATSATPGNVPRSSRQPSAAAREAHQSAYMAAVLDILTEPGGVLDRMDAAGHHFGFVATPAQIASRMRQMASDDENPVSDGAPAQTTREIVFGRVGDREVYPAGTLCELFPGRNPPRNDFDAAVIKSSILQRKDSARELAVIRLAGRLRIVHESSVRLK